jgi:hypothetical protein
MLACVTVTSHPWLSKFKLAKFHELCYCTSHTSCATHGYRVGQHRCRRCTDWRCGSGLEYLLSSSETPGSVPSTAKEKKQNDRAILEHS